MSVSETINIILTLLLLWQWHKGYAKEQSVKYNLLGIKRILDSDRKQTRNIPLKEFLDATLATIGARQPFVEEGKRVLNSVLQKNKITSNGKIRETTKNL